MTFILLIFNSLNSKISVYFRHDELGFESSKQNAIVEKMYCKPYYTQVFSGLFCNSCHGNC